MIDSTNLEVWFVAGSQHLYGPEVLKDVKAHSTAIARSIHIDADPREDHV
jgi:L-arabinose isomerase